MKTGSAIKSLLAIRGLTIKELAEKAGISVNTLYSITKRDTVNIYSDNLQKILKALECSVSDFVVAASEDDQYPVKPKLTKDEQELHRHYLLLARIEDVSSGGESSLLKYYWRLSPTGQIEALQRIRELGMIDKYKLKD